MRGPSPGSLSYIHQDSPRRGSYGQSPGPAVDFPACNRGGRATLFESTTRGTRDSNPSTADRLSPPVAALSADSAPLTFFQNASRLFDQARQAAGSVDHDFRVGGHVIRLRSAGPALVSPLTRALAHLAVPPVTSPALTVSLWDSESTGTPALRPSWSSDAYREHGAIEGFCDGRIYTVFQWGAQAVSLLDVERSEALYWIKSADKVPYFETAAPLRTILHLWFRMRHIHFVHAAAVGYPDGGVLLVGNGGSGKSTTALLCLESGLRYLADDYCLVRTTPAPLVSSLYSSAKTWGDLLPRLPALASMVTNLDRPHDEKALYFLHEHHPALLLSECPLRAILVPRLRSRPETTVVSAPAAAALAALAPSTMLQLPGMNETTLRGLAGLVRKVPCHYLDLGTDTAGVPAAIARLLAEDPVRP